MNQSFVDWVRGKENDSAMLWEEEELNSPERNQQIETARNLLERISFEQNELSGEEVDEAWKNVLLKSQPKRNKLKTYHKVSPLLVAASIALFVLSFVGGIYLTQYASFSESDTITKTTKNGQKLTHHLPDGTRVMLNSGSTISYDVDFEDTSKERRVWLTGEAFFEVAHDEKRPFVVVADNIRVRVLGTSFNVNAREKSQRINVALIEGKVQIEKEESAWVLKPGELATIGKNSGQMSIDEVDLQPMVAWRDGVLVFEKSNFSETLTTIEQWYGVEIEVDEEYTIGQEWRFHGKFRKKSLAYVLESIRYPNQFQYKIENKKVLIYNE